MLSQISLDKNKNLAPRDSLGVFNASIMGNLPFCISFLRPFSLLLGHCSFLLDPFTPACLFSKALFILYQFPSLPLISPQRPYSSLLVPFTPHTSPQRRYSPSLAPFVHFMLFPQTLILNSISCHFHFVTQLHKKTPGHFYSQAGCTLLLCFCIFIVYFLFNFFKLPAIF